MTVYQQTTDARDVYRQTASAPMMAIASASSVCNTANILKNSTVRVSPTGNTLIPATYSQR